MVDLKEKEDIIEIQCQECKAEFEMKYLETETGEPEYCPFCGADLLYDDLDEEEDDKEEWDDYDEDDYDNR
tara:strand:+ start:505 stop:717 length:213 start_codon:yes stop_codon:yes gene_type:complete